MAGDFVNGTRNGLAIKVLAGLAVTLIGAGVVGIWNMRADVAAIAATVAELGHRLDRLEAQTEVRLERYDRRLQELGRGDER